MRGFGWYDEGLDAACEFEVASDGELRCLPERAGSIAFLGIEGCLGRRFFRTGGPIEGDLFKIGVDLPPCRPVERVPAGPGSDVVRNAWGPSGGGVIA